MSPLLSRVSPFITISPYLLSDCCICWHYPHPRLSLPSHPAKYMLFREKRGHANAGQVHLALEFRRRTPSTFRVSGGRSESLVSLRENRAARRAGSRRRKPPFCTSSYVELGCGYRRRRRGGNSPVRRFVRRVGLWDVEQGTEPSWARPRTATAQTSVPQAPAQARSPRASHHAGRSK